MQDISRNLGKEISLDGGGLEKPKREMHFKVERGGSAGSQYERRS